MAAARDSPPSTASVSCIDSVSPTGTSASSTERRAAADWRCASASTSFTARRRAESRRPGGKAPVRYPCSATMLGSLMVHAQPTVSASAAPARSQKEAKRAAVSGSSHPPRCDTQRGVVKWWNVTMGVSPAARHESQTRR